MRDYGLSSQDANTLTEDKALGDYFEQVVAVSAAQNRAARAKAAANLTLNDVARLLKAHSTDISQILLTPAASANLLDLLDANRSAELFEKEFHVRLYFRQASA